MHKVINASNNQILELEPGCVNKRKGIWYDMYLDIHHVLENKLDRGVCFWSWENFDARNESKGVSEECFKT